MGKRIGFLCVGRLLRFIPAKGALHYHMKNTIRRFLLLALWTAVAQSADACTVCMGGNTTVGEAANGAIFVMLGVLVVVLGFISVVGFLIVRKGRLPLPPHAELARSLAGANVD
jgi:hypothetical protein